MTKSYRIYMDDSGNVGAATTNAPELRYGSVTAVILPTEYLDNTFDISLPAVAEKHFGLDEDGLPCRIHRRVLAGRPPPEGPFAVLADPEKRSAWDADVLRMFERAQYTVITACVDKVAWYWRYPNWRGDFYEVLVAAVLERCFYFLKNRNATAEAFIEHKNGPSNDRVTSAFERQFIDGFDRIPAASVAKVFSCRSLGIIQKRDRVPGCQLADLIAGPATHHIRALNGAGDPVQGDFTAKLVKLLDEKKFYREGSGPLDGYGRIWRPKGK